MAKNKRDEQQEAVETEAQRLFDRGDYGAARKVCGEQDRDLETSLATDPLFIYIYVGGLAVIGVLGALTMG